MTETENKVTNKFKAGDRVRLTGSEWVDHGFDLQEVVTIVGIDDDGDPYFEAPQHDREDRRFYVYEGREYSAELVTDHQGEYVAPDLSGLANGVTDVESAAIGLSKLADVMESQWEKGADEFNFQNSVEAVTSDIASMLIAKNKAYGNSALDPIRTFSKANAREQLLVRIDDKLSRIARGHDFPNEDTIDDLIGYLVLLKIAGNGYSED